MESFKKTINSVEYFVKYNSTKHWRCGVSYEVKIAKITSKKLPEYNGSDILDYWQLTSIIENELCFPLV